MSDGKYYLYVVECDGVKFNNISDEDPAAYSALLKIEGQGSVLLNVIPVTREDYRDAKNILNGNC